MRVLLAAVWAASLVAGEAMAAGDEQAVLCQASDHPIRYFVSTQSECRERPQRWPVLVCVAGADSDFRGLLEKYRRVRGGRPFLIVAPCTFLNTNAIAGWMRDHYRQFYPEEVIRQAEAGRLDWDEAGLLAILRDLERNHGAESRACLTGFSGGGLLVYRMVLARPERLSAAVPVCANYFGDAAGHVEVGRADRSLPVRLINGGRDRHGRYWLDGRPPLLPGLPVACCLVAGATAGGALLAWRWKRRRWEVAFVIAFGALLLGLLVINRESGLEGQGAAALRRLRDRGYTDVTQVVVADIAQAHEPAPERVLGILPPPFCPGGE